MLLCSIKWIRLLSRGCPEASQSLFSKRDVTWHDQKRWINDSEILWQKVQFSFSFLPILNRNLLVGLRLCKSLNWNSISLVLFVQLGAMRYACSQLRVVFSSKRLQSWNHLFWLLLGVKPFVLYKLTGLVFDFLQSYHRVFQSYLL